MDLSAHLPKFRSDFSYDDWLKWKELFEVYLQTRNLYSATQRLAYLKIIGGLELIDLLNNLSPSNTPGAGRFVSLIETDEYSDALNRVDDHFEQARNPIKERYEFRTMVQNNGERMKEFVLRLRTQANKCEFDDLDKEVMDQLITGTKDPQVRKKALMNRYSSVQEIMAEAMVNESVAAQVKSLPSTSINYLKPQQAAPGPSRRRDKKKVECYNCHKLGHYSFECTNQSTGLKCFHCRKLGHATLRCRLKMEPPPRPYQVPAKGSTGAVRKSINHVEKQRVEKEEQAVEYISFLGCGEAISCKIGGVSLTLLVDSGTRSNIIDKPNWDILCSRKATMTFQKKSDKQFIPFGSTEPIPVLESFTANLVIGGRKASAKFYVVDMIAKCLLGSESAKALGVLKIGIDNVSTMKKFS